MIKCCVGGGKSPCSNAAARSNKGSAVQVQEVHKISDAEYKYTNFHEVQVHEVSDQKYKMLVPISCPSDNAFCESTVQSQHWSNNKP